MPLYVTVVARVAGLGWWPDLVHSSHRILGFPRGSMHVDSPVLGLGSGVARLSVI